MKTNRQTAPPEPDLTRISLYGRGRQGLSLSLPGVVSHGLTQLQAVLTDVPVRWSHRTTEKGHEEVSLIISQAALTKIQDEVLGNLAPALASIQHRRARLGMSLNTTLQQKQGDWFFAVAAAPNLKNWKRKLDVSTYLREGPSIAELIGSPELKFKVGTRNFEITGPLDSGSTVGSAVEFALNAYESFMHAVDEKHEASSTHSVTTEFCFPTDVRTACEQYLLHFVDFLRDLGVEARAQLNETASRVLFSVTPTDKNQALDRIREALEIYLQLPTAQFVAPDLSQDEQLAVTRLQMNVHHLKAQLDAANLQRIALAATAQAQQATIQAQQLTIDVLRPSASRVPELPKVGDYQPVLGGIVSLGKVERGGVTVNIAELYRRMRRLVQR
jgi:hypothetical protein